VRVVHTDAQTRASIEIFFTFFKLFFSRKPSIDALKFSPTATNASVKFESSLRGSPVKTANRSPIAKSRRIVTDVRRLSDTDDESDRKGASFVNLIEPVCIFADDVTVVSTLLAGGGEGSASTIPFDSLRLTGLQKQLRKEIAVRIEKLGPCPQALAEKPKVCINDHFKIDEMSDGQSARNNEQ
jgi:hypothetical protein